MASALEQYDNAQKIYESVNSKFRIAFCKANRGNILWRFGHYDQAQQLIDEVLATIAAQKGNFLQLLPASPPRECGNAIESTRELWRRDGGERGQRTGRQAIPGRDDPGQVRALVCRRRFQADRRKRRSFVMRR